MDGAGRLDLGGQSVSTCDLLGDIAEGHVDVGLPNSSSMEPMELIVGAHHHAGRSVRRHIDFQADDLAIEDLGHRSALFARRDLEPLSCSQQRAVQELEALVCDADGAQVGDVDGLIDQALENVVHHFLRDIRAVDLEGEHVEQGLFTVGHGRCLRGLQERVSNSNQVSGGIAKTWPAETASGSSMPLASAMTRHRVLSPYSS